MANCKRSHSEEAERQVQYKKPPRGEESEAIEASDDEMALLGYVANHWPLLKSLQGTQKAAALLALQRTHGNRYVQRLAEELSLPEPTESVNEEIIEAIERQRGRGQPLEPAIQASIGLSLGQDLSGVRLHTDDEADRLSRAVSAIAFTTGKDIFFRRGSYRPDTIDGLRLLAHELVHVAQQTGGARLPQMSSPEDASEREAEHLADRMFASPMPVAALQERGMPVKEHVAIMQRQAAPSSGRVVIRGPRYTYYNVTGRTLAEAATRLGPDEWGRCTWNFRYTPRSTGGTATRVDVTLGLTIRLPRWAGRGRASDAAKAEWDRMVAALRTHEDGHADIARRWATELQQRLLNQPVADLKSLWDQGLADHQAEQDAYDTETDHGQNQGVTLDTSIE